MVVSRWRWIRLEEESVDRQFRRPRVYLHLLRGPLLPSTNVTDISDRKEARSQIDQRYKGNR